MLPLIKPSLAAIAIFTFLGTWNNFMGPLIYIADQRLYPLAFGLYAFSVQVANNPALTMAGSLRIADCGLRTCLAGRQVADCPR